ncbi:Adenylate kinase [Amphibacillus marinus]|uniref:Adenylate kinase n=1 Tax=Amphibacillus marinus TaxID=872970 RepID=A0A1H8LMI9_9BACI|nr:DNA topology modulation protein FlaR [Amphibacillus marinus]SEO06016.1 Adenylate kinase [Amphibacillus marinus]
MEKLVPAQIHIIGSVGSGKTTLARILSDKFNLVHYELDNVVWQRGDGNDVRRTSQARDDYLNEIVMLDAWIIEGAHHKWVQPSLEKADLIIFLDPKYSIRVFRIIRRFILQKLRLEESNYQPTWSIFRQMFMWNAFFERSSKHEIIALLSQYGDKVVICKSKADVKSLFSR